MARVKSTSMLIGAALLASVGSSNAARADIVTYNLRFNSGGSQVGSAVLTLQNITPTSTVTINAANNNASDFASITGSISGFTFTDTSFAPFNSSASNGETGGITIANGKITNIFTAFGGGGFFTTDPGPTNLFFDNSKFNPPPLVFTLGTTTGTVSVSDPQVAAVPEPSTWVMMILGFAGLAFMAIRRRKMFAAV